MKIQEYIRNKKNNKVGLLTAEQINGSVYVAWSKCCKKDKFNKEEGQKLCRQRAEQLKTVWTTEADSTGLPAIPDTVKKQYRNFVFRAIKCFKSDSTFVFFSDDGKAKVISVHPIC